ncbi:DUF7344 domain-containing protein [Halovivax cerinus]|uniref:ArsR family transcriptional regulator n=1 Tax=Halovivax cerinus TaxID=1487865 RepID=A0ABD5NMU4_9EURY|nr:ArsR family transcriptional regulator [Halovivax cerinus]
MSSRTDATGELAESDVFHILGNDRRREIVSLLAAANGPIDVSDVARRVASREHDDSDTVPNNLYKSVYVSLQQTHLPQLEAERIIVYDSDAKTIQQGAQFDHVCEYIDGATDGNRLFRHATGVIATIGIALSGASGFGLAVTAVIPPAHWAVMSLLAIALWSLSWTRLRERLDPNLAR